MCQETCDTTTIETTTSAAWTEMVPGMTLRICSRLQPQQEFRGSSTQTSGSQGQPSGGSAHTACLPDGHVSADLKTNGEHDGCILQPIMTPPQIVRQWLFCLHNACHNVEIRPAANPASCLQSQYNAACCAVPTPFRRAQSFRSTMAGRPQGCVHWRHGAGQPPPPPLLLCINLWTRMYLGRGRLMGGFRSGCKSSYRDRSGGFRGSFRRLEGIGGGYKLCQGWQ